MKRVIFDIILLVSVFILPWWISALLLLIGIFIFDNFYEFILACAITYSLYSVPNGKLIASPIFFSLIIIFSYVLIQAIKKNIILYKNEISY